MATTKKRVSDANKPKEKSTETVKKTTVANAQKTKEKPRSFTSRRVWPD